MRRIRRRRRRRSDFPASLEDSSVRSLVVLYSVGHAPTVSLAYILAICAAVRDK